MSKTIIITSIPAFYKINLYNEISRKLDIFVIFISSTTSEKRASDFTKNKFDFEYIILSNSNLQNRNILKSILSLKKALKSISINKIIIGGWDLIEYWYIIIFKRSFNIELALESTFIESSNSILKTYLKKLFLKRISKVYCSGENHKMLLDSLRFSKHISITKGVGIINKSGKTKSLSNYEKKFLFIGRLEKIKNLELVIEIFNELPDHSLTIIGVGSIEEKLKAKTKSKNIFFKGDIQNSDLIKYFKETNFLILPSLSETWGLVVEEALYNKTPVILSRNCGSQELIKESYNGILFDPLNKKELKNKILKIDQKLYESLRENVKDDFIDNKDLNQIKSYL
jgi:glycosyltransferase involved in cell wall biosynthesis